MTGKTRWAAITITILLFALQAIVGLALSVGCAETHALQITSVEVTGEARLAVHTTQGSASWSLQVFTIVDADTGDTIVCPVLTLDLTLYLDVYITGVPPSLDVDGNGAQDVDERCYNGASAAFRPIGFGQRPGQWYGETP